MALAVNTSELNIYIKFGRESDQPEYDQNDNPIPGFESLWTTLAGHLSLTTTQAIEQNGTGHGDDFPVIVRHRSHHFWQTVTQAKIGDDIYQVVSANQARNNGPTAFDTVTLRAVTER
jgi:hypothetical protein